MSRVNILELYRGFVIPAQAGIQLIEGFPRSGTISALSAARDGCLVGFRPAPKVGNPLSAKADVELPPPE